MVWLYFFSGSEVWLDRRGDETIQLEGVDDAGHCVHAVDRT